MVRKWVINKWKFDKVFLSRLADQTGYPLEICNFLASHGYLTKSLIDKFLNPSDTADFCEYQDSEILLEFLIKNKSRKILIYGDYDCDGIGASSILYMGLIKLGFKCNIFINSRFIHGYGINTQALDEIKAKGIDLVLSVDQGIVAYDQIEYANSLGIDILVLDHHKANEILPKAIAVVDPWRLDDNSGFKSYCSGALAYQLLVALAKKLEEDPEKFLPLLGIVALTTISDVMPLKESNRYYVIEGLKQINSGSLTAYKVLRDYYKKDLSEDDLRFYVTPTINAVGRVQDDMQKVLQFLVSNNYDQSLQLYSEIVNINRKRQKLTNEDLEIAQKQVEKNDLANIIVGDFHEGLIGIIAGRIKSDTNKVTVVLSKQETQYKGSIRSVEGFNLKYKLDMIQDIFNNYGGHDMAAGISFDLDKLEEFKKQFVELIDIKCDESINVDYIYKTSELDKTTLALWDSFKPYGPQFEYPTFGLVVEDYNTIILKEKYLKFTTNNINIMAFNSLEYLPIAKDKQKLKVLVKFDKDKYNNYQAILIDKEIRKL